MKRKLIAALSLGALGAFAALPCFAQSETTRMPYEKEFWTTGHAGAELGYSRLDIGCPAGGSCDNRASAAKLFAGGRFNNIFGGEVSYFRTGSFDRSTGDLEFQALNLGVLAGIPFGPSRNSSVFAKAGLLWGHSEAASLSQNGWGASYGLGGTLGITRSLGARVDWDRYRFKLPGAGGDRDNVDAFLVGLQYTFGNPR